MSRSADYDHRHCADIVYSVAQRVPACKVNDLNTVSSHSTWGVIAGIEITSVVVVNALGVHSSVGAAEFTLAIVLSSDRGSGVPATPAAPDLPVCFQSNALPCFQ